MCSTFPVSYRLQFIELTTYNTHTTPPSGPTLKHPQFMIFLQDKSRNYTPKVTVSYILIMVFIWKTEFASNTLKVLAGIAHPWIFLSAV